MRIALCLVLSSAAAVAGAQEASLPLDTTELSQTEDNEFVISSNGSTTTNLGNRASSAAYLITTNWRSSRSGERPGANMLGGTRTMGAATGSLAWISATRRLPYGVGGEVEQQACRLVYEQGEAVMGTSSGTATKAAVAELTTRAAACPSLQNYADRIKSLANPPLHTLTPRSGSTIEITINSPDTGESWRASLIGR